MLHRTFTSIFFAYHKLLLTLTCSKRQYIYQLQKWGSRKYNKQIKDSRSDEQTGTSFSQVDFGEGTVLSGDNDPIPAYSQSDSNKTWEGPPISPLTYFAKTNSVASSQASDTNGTESVSYILRSIRETATIYLLESSARLDTRLLQLLSVTQNVDNRRLAADFLLSVAHYEAAFTLYAVILTTPESEACSESVSYLFAEAIVGCIHSWVTEDQKETTREIFGNVKKLFDLPVEIPLATILNCLLHVGLGETPCKRSDQARLELGRLRRNMCLVEVKHCLEWCQPILSRNQYFNLEHRLGRLIFLHLWECHTLQLANSRNGRELPLSWLQLLSRERSVTASEVLLVACHMIVLSSSFNKETREIGSKSVLGTRKSVVYPKGDCEKLLICGDQEFTIVFDEAYSNLLPHQRWPYTKPRFGELTTKSNNPVHNDHPIYIDYFSALNFLERVFRFNRENHSLSPEVINEDPSRLDSPFQDQPSAPTVNELVSSPAGQSQHSPRRKSAVSSLLHRVSASLSSESRVWSMISWHTTSSFRSFRETGTRIKEIVSGAASGADSQPPSDFLMDFRGERLSTSSISGEASSYHQQPVISELCEPFDSPPGMDLGRLQLDREDALMEMFW